MNNFLRAVKLASHHWPSVAMAAVCSFAVAALWGANIGAFFPILEVTIRGQSTQQWIDDEIVRLTTEVATKTRMLEELQNANVVGGARENVEAGRLDADIKAAATQLKSYEKLKPWVNKFIPSSPFQTVSLIVAVLIVSTLIKHFFLITNEVLVGKVALNISNDLRNRIFNKAVTIDRTTFNGYGQSKFVTLVIHTTEMLSNGLVNVLGAALREPLKIVACAIGAAWICWRLLLLSSLIAPFVGVLLYVLTRRLKSVSSRVLERAAGFHDVLLESLGNINTIQSYQREEFEQQRFEASTALLKRNGLRFIFLSSLSKPIIEFLGIGMLGTTIIGGAYLVLNQQTHILGIRICDQPMSVSALLVFFGMLVGMSDPLRKLSAVYSTIYAGTVAADTLFPILDRPSLIGDPEKPRDVSHPHGSLTLRQLSFSYVPNHEVLSAVDLEIPYGSTIAIIGGNGSGKSTMINLLCRFYDPTQGSVCLDGVDYRDMRVQDVRSRIALVTQQTELFNETVAYNIRYGRPTATDEEVETAARRAHAHEFIVGSLQQGYQTRVGQNGCRLSGGQRQRIALAQALLCDPEILILDEATSQIDMHSEQLIRESLAEDRGARTIIIITHREKLLELADRVYKMDRGKLVVAEQFSTRAA
ncbi:MAG: ABC transporter ATP-binding protein [Planctomycetales bacterium]|nr:ABC transporter ATP-binding protein [Planctomycetales bacterium]